MNVSRFTQFWCKFLGVLKIRWCKSVTTVCKHQETKTLNLHYILSGLYIMNKFLNQISSAIAPVLAMITMPVGVAASVTCG